MGTIGYSGTKEERYGRGGHISGAEENQGELREVWVGEGGILTPSPHGENTWDGPDTDLGGRHWKKGAGDIHCVFSTVTEVHDMHCRWMPRKGKQPRETHRTLHVLTLEGEYGDYKGGTRTTATMRSLWDAYARGLDDET